MINNLQHIKFENKQNPNAGFDIVDLEGLYSRKDIDHPPHILHVVEFYMIILIDGGQGYHTIDFTDYPCKKGTLLTIRKDQIHKFFQHSKLKGSMLLFTNEFLISYLENLEAQKSLQLFNELLGAPTINLSNTEFKEIKKLVTRLKQEYFDINDGYSLSIIRSELHILITKLYRIKSQTGQIISDKKYLNEFIAFQELVEANATNTTRVKDYAKLMGLSTKTLNTITKNIVHKTAKEFVDEILTKQIKRLLINTDHSIKEIAYTSGFEETTNFYKYFKRQTQVTPEQFRFTH